MSVTRRRGESAGVGRGWRRCFDLVALGVLHASMAMACLAAIGKLVDLPAFVGSMSTWRMIPAWARVPLATGVPIVEVGASLAWLLGMWRRGALVVVWVGLLAVTGVYGAHVALATAPECNCFGVLLRYERWTHQAWLVMGRNAALLAAVGVAGGLWWARGAGRTGVWPRRTG